MTPDAVTGGSAPSMLAWVGDGAPRMEVAHIETMQPHLTAHGTQLGVTYELRYWLGRDRLLLELVGERRLEFSLAGADFFDLGFSPLFNSLPVLRDRLLDGGSPREYRMQWVDVPTLEVSVSHQRYEPLKPRVVRFSAGEFESLIRFDDAGFVLSYPGIAERVPVNS